ncbi:MAG: DUF362 domain-containing protein [Candidatus Aminicenantes bacterium]|nr:DUF362 domain-containing protein [Candidatus Aminicenantes bacterium]
MNKKNFTRRDFLKAAAATPLAGVWKSGLGHGGMQNEEEKSRVVLIRDKNALVSLKQPDAGAIQKMLDDAVATLFGEKNVNDAWKKIVEPSDIVGIKSNIWRFIPTTTEVEQAIKKRLLGAGVIGENISINDRSVRSDPVFQKATILINARPMRSHHWSGVGSLIKNYITFTPNWPAWHGDSCADLAKIWTDFSLKEKTKLNILVMLTPLFHGIGPHHYSQKYVWEYRGLIVGRDPVAVDATGLRIIEAKRREFFGEDRPLRPPAKHIFLADTRHKLGNSRPEKIELIKLGWKEDILI